MDRGGRVGGGAIAGCPGAGAARLGNAPGKSPNERVMMIKRLLRLVLIAGGCYVCSLPSSGCIPADRVSASMTAWVTAGSPNIVYLD